MLPCGFALQHIDQSLRDCYEQGKRMRRLSLTYMDNDGHISERTDNRGLFLARERVGRRNSPSRIPDNDELDMVSIFRQYYNIDAQVAAQQLSEAVV